MAVPSVMRTLTLTLPEVPLVRSTVMTAGPAFSTTEKSGVANVRSPGRVLVRAPAYQTAKNVGFHIVERWQFHRTQVLKSTR